MPSPYDDNARIGGPMCPGLMQKEFHARPLYIYSACIQLSQQNACAAKQAGWMCASHYRLTLEMQGT